MKQRRKELLSVLGLLALAFYVGGFLELLFTEAKIRLNPFSCLAHGFGTGKGFWFSVLVIPVFGLVAAVIAWRGKSRETAGRDEERNFEYSVKGTYGTAGYMEKEVQKKVLEFHKDAGDVRGVIFGTDLEEGSVLSLPVDSPLNRNFAVCGSQGSMKSRAFARMMALQCIRRGR